MCVRACVVCAWVRAWCVCEWVRVWCMCEWVCVWCLRVCMHAWFVHGCVRGACVSGACVRACVRASVYLRHRAGCYSPRGWPGVGSHHNDSSRHVRPQRNTSPLSFAVPRRTPQNTESDRQRLTQCTHVVRQHNNYTKAKFLIIQLM